MQKSFLAIVLLLLLCCCKKTEFPLNPGDIMFYHEINGQIVSIVYLPSAFSPGKNGINDLYRPVANGMSVLFKMTIYDRWGTEMFETTDRNNGWDGMVKGITVSPGEYQTVLNLMDTTGYIYDIHSKMMVLN